jgi:aspartate carbamoyltransferase catalytic subunit
MSSKAKFDYKDLTEDEQKTLNDIAEKAAETAVAERSIDAPTDSAKAPLLRSMNPAARDAFSYSVSMKKDGKKVQVEFDDTNAPPELVSLFQKYIKY